MNFKPGLFIFLFSFREGVQRVDEANETTMKKTTILFVMALVCQKKLKAEKVNLTTVEAITKPSLLIALVLMLGIGHVSAQEIKALKVGDQVPESFWQQEHSIYVNGKTSKQTLVQYKGIPLILDFWATWCSPCVAAMRKLDSLNAVYEGKVMILPVTHQTSKDVMPFFKSRKYLNLSFILADRSVGALFPHQILPHYVWIDKTGTILRFTEHVNDTSIQQFVQQGKVNLENKIDVPLIPHDVNKPFLVAGNGGDGANLLYHSVLTTYAGNLVAGTAVRHDEAKGWKIAAFDVSLAKLYKLAYGLTKNYLNDKNVSYQVLDRNRLTSKLVGSAYANWKAQGNAFSYEIVAPTQFSGEQVFVMMQQELSKLFPQYKITEQNQISPVYALVRTDTLTRFVAKGGAFELKYHADGINMAGGSFDQLIMLLEKTFYSNTPYTLINETGYSGKVDLDLATNFKDVKLVNEQLGRYGLQFIATEREVKKLIIADSGLPIQNVN